MDNVWKCKSEVKRFNLNGMNGTIYSGADVGFLLRRALLIKNNTGIEKIMKTGSNLPYGNTNALQALMLYEESFFRRSISKALLD